MLMPMVWTNDFNMLDDFDDWFDPFDGVVSLVDVEPTRHQELRRTFD